MSIEERGKALEEAFFAKKNKELLEQVKAQLDASTQRDNLKAACGIEDDGLLDQLIENGLNAESITAMSMVPLVLVAWADGSVNDKEREAILSSAEQAGIKSDSVASQMLIGWLDQAPDASLTDVWKDYVGAVAEKLPAGEKIKLGEQILSRCQQVAESAGGFLGLASISAQEKTVLDMLKATLS